LGNLLLAQRYPQRSGNKTVSLPPVIGVPPWLYMPLAKQAALRKDDLLEPVDQLLEDAQLLARQKGVAKGHKMRTDTTAVESNVHFPTDSALWETAFACSAAA